MLLKLTLLWLSLISFHLTLCESHANPQALSQIAIHRTIQALDSTVSIRASPSLLGSKGESAGYVTVKFSRPNGAEASDWIGVFSPGSFNASSCASDTNGTNRDYVPLLCTSPIKYHFANFSTSNYVGKGEGSLKFRLVNQRSDFAFALFAGGLVNPELLAVSNKVSFAYPKAPLYPRLALTNKWDEMTVTWTSGYSQKEAIPIVKWGITEENLDLLSPAGTLTFDRFDMCGSPARTIGWRDPGYIHTAFLQSLWPNSRYFYKVGHKLKDGSYVWGESRSFTAAPFPGQDSLQQIIIFGDMGKGQEDGSNQYNDFQPGSLNTTASLIKDVENIDLIFHIGDLCYANGYLSQWDQFTEQIEPLASVVPYMVASGNHERDWPGTGSFYKNTDSGGECGVLAQTMFNMPLKNREHFWYSMDYGLFRFCIADSEHDWREGTEQYKFIEECLASADRQKQPWLIFAAHRVLGYSSDFWYGQEGTFAEPMGRDSLQNLWQKYKVDIAFYGHVHNYERTCQVYQSQCIGSEKSHFSGTFNATIHVVVGGAGASLSNYTTIETKWSVFKDMDHGFGKLTAFNHTSLLFEYKKSQDGKVHDSFHISREYKDILGCDALENCPSLSLAS